MYRIIQLPTLAAASDADDSKQSELQRLVNQHHQIDTERNQRLKRRLPWLLPYNCVAMYATYRLMAGIKTIHKRVWPTRQKFTWFNLLFLSTQLSVFWLTTYFSGTFLVLRVNPVEEWRYHKSQINAELNLMAQQDIDVDGSITQLVQLPQNQESRTKSFDLFRSVSKGLGLSERTLLTIERDLRQQHSAYTQTCAMAPLASMSATVQDAPFASFSATVQLRKLRDLP